MSTSSITVKFLRVFLKNVPNLTKNSAYDLYTCILNVNCFLTSECSTQLDLTLGRFPALKVLYLRQNPLSVCDHHLFTIARYCPFLLELDLGDCEGLTDAGLAGHAGIASLRQLHSLNLSRLVFHCFTTLFRLKNHLQNQFR